MFLCVEVLCDGPMCEGPICKVLRDIVLYRVPQI